MVKFIPRYFLFVGINTEVHFILSFQKKEGGGERKEEGGRRDILLTPQMPTIVGTGSGPKMGPGSLVGGRHTNTCAITAYSPVLHSQEADIGSRTKNQTKAH